MKALHRRWKLALAVALVACGGAAVFFPVEQALPGGIVLGIGLAWLFESLDRSIKTVDEVSGRLGLSVYAVVPRCVSVASDQPERQLVTGFPADHPSVRAFQTLRCRLDSAKGNNDGQVIMVTSCIPGEGKSTVSGNLAASLGQAGARVLLIGCDLRRSTLGKMFGREEQPGLTELLASGDQSSLRSLAVPAIDFIPGGGIPDNPVALLDSKQMRDLLEFARSRYDYVVLDAPPILPVTDGQLLAPQADVLLAVMEPCRTQMEMARQLIESLQAVGQQIDGVVLNDRSGLGARYYGVDQDRIATARAAGPSRPATARWRWAVAAAGLAGVAIAVPWWLASNERTATPTAVSLPSAGSSQAKSARPASGHEQPVVGVDSRPIPGAAGLPAAVKRADTGPRPPAVPAPDPAPADASALAPPPAAAKAAPPAGLQPATIPRIPEPSAQPTQAKGVPEPVAAVVPAAALPAVAPRDLQEALVALASSWQKPLPARFAGDNPLEWFAAMGLQGSVIADDLAVLLQLNTPLLIESRQEQAGTTWLAVVGRKGFKWLVSPRTTRGELLSETELKELWTGTGYLLSQDPLHLVELDERTAPPEQVARLQQLLVKVGTLQQFEAGVLDRETIKAIGHLQATNGLRVNGRITPETLVLLYQADPSFRSPKFALWQ